MAEAAKAQEPSMEEILASIRRIIADDEGTKPGEAAAAPVPAPATQAVAPAPTDPLPAAPLPEVAFELARDAEADEADAADAQPGDEEEAPDAPESAEVLELTPAMEARQDARQGARERSRADETPAPAFRMIDARSDLVFTDPTPPRPLRREFEPSPSPAASVRDFPGASRPEPEDARTLLSDQATAAVTSAFGSLAHTVLAQNARTLEDLVGEMLRPMLKSWLDDNLPTIVERLVRAEIERVSRGRT